MGREKFCEHKAPTFDKFFAIDGIRYVLCRKCGLPIEATGVPLTAVIPSATPNGNERPKELHATVKLPAKELSPYCACDEPAPNMVDTKGSGPILCGKCYKPIKGTDRRAQVTRSIY